MTEEPPPERTRARAVAINTASQFGSFLLNNILATVVGIIIVRHVGRSEYGLMVFVVSYLSYFLPLSSLGVDTLLTREVARSPDRASDIVGGAFGLRIGLSVATMLLAWAVVPFASDEPRVIPLVMLYSCLLLFSVQGLYQVVFIAELRSHVMNAAFAVWSLLFTLLRLGLVLAGARIGHFLASDVLSGAVGLFLSRWIAGRHSTFQPHVRIDWALWGRLLAQSWPVFLASWFIALHNRIDQTLLFRFKGADALGGYSAAVRISEVWVVFANVFMFSIFPLLSRDAVGIAGRIERTSSLTYRYLYVIILPIALVLAFDAEPLLRLLFGPAFADAAGSLRLLAAAEVFVFSNSVTYNILFSSGLQKQAATISGAALVFNGLLNLFWIPRWGATGAALASALSYASVPLLALALPASRWIAVSAFSTLARPAFAAGAAGLVLWSVNATPVAGLALLCLVYPAALAVTGALDRHDLALARRAFASDAGKS